MLMLYNMIYLTGTYISGCFLKYNRMIGNSKINIALKKKSLDNSLSFCVPSVQH